MKGSFFDVLYHVQRPDGERLTTEYPEYTEKVREKQAYERRGSRNGSRVRAGQERLTTEYAEYTEKGKRKTGIGKAGTTERIEGESRSRAIDHEYTEKDKS